MSLGTELLTVEEMYRADALAIEGGVPGIDLMAAAGKGIADIILEKWHAGRALVLCGPGNNGGDGYVVARLLKEAGWQVELAAIGDPAALKGDAAVMRDRWDGEILAPEGADVSKADIVVDAIFGAGFSRKLEEPVTTLLAKVKAAGCPVVAVDVPSGMNGSDGAVDVGAVPAVLTVTFFRPKAGHYLFPGRGFCGELHVVDIGIEARYLTKIAPKVRCNDPLNWRDDLPRPGAMDHKYSRGHAGVGGGGVSSTGAARLAARAALRSGAGAVTVACPPAALMIYSAALTAVMVKPCADAEEFAGWIRERRVGTLLLGPGNGVTARTRAFVEVALASSANVILDADAITLFREEPETLFSQIREKRAQGKGGCLLTPHEAEFARIFACGGSKLERALAGAEMSGAVVLLKGADTVIASPEGEAVINHNAPACLATAGSGDVLAGIVCGLISGGMPLFSAAAAGCWLHGEAGNRLGAGMIAEDIEGCLPALLQTLGKKTGNM